MIRSVGLRGALWGPIGGLQESEVSEKREKKEMEREEEESE